MQILHCAAGAVELALGAAAGLSWWFVGDPGLLKNAGVIQMLSSRLVTTANRALPVCEGPVLGMP